MANRVLVAGVGMVPFATPSKSDSYDVMAEGALRAALADAGTDLAAVQQVYAGYVYGDSTSGQNARLATRWHWWCRSPGGSPRRSRGRE
jgi:sterol carrier protein 2